MKMFLFVERFLYPEGVSRIPPLMMLLVFINTFFYSMISTMPFSFLPKMVKSFGISEVEVGRYAGLLASSVFVGRIISSMPWGYLTNNKGKKFSTLLTGILSIATSLAFGFSLTFTWSLATRFFQGLAAGQLVVLKGVLSDICDDTNQAMGLAIFMTGFSVGNIVGPSVGGFTAFLADQYPRAISKNSVIGKYPVLLPHIIIASDLGLGTLFAVFLLPKDRSRNAEKTPLLRENTSDRSNLFLTTFVDQLKSSGVVKVLKIKECWMCCLLYGTFALVDIGFNEMFPVLASTAPHLKGLGMKPSQLGTVLMVVSIFLIVVQLTVLPKLSNYLGPKKLLISSNLMLTFWMPLLPSVCAISNITLQWMAIVLLILIIRASTAAGYLAIMILIQNSADAELVGSANGLTMMAASLGRLAGPALSGSIYSWSLHNIVGVKANTNPLGFPFNQFFTFHILSLSSVIIAMITTILPKEMDHSKKKETGQN